MKSTLVPTSVFKLVPLSRKQKRSIFRANARINLWDGAVRSGKTVGSIIRWLKFVRDAPKRGALVIMGRTKDSIARNVLDVIADIDPGAIVFTRGAPTCKIYGREVHVVGAHDVKAEATIRGWTLYGAYVDEATVIPHVVWKQLLNRLSVPGAKLFATTNPDTPSHWLMKEFIRKLELPIGHKDRPNMVRFQFRLPDNPSLDDDYKRSLIAENHGLWYDRNIDGKWVAAEGAIYGLLDDKVHCKPAPPPDRWQQAWVGIDYGTSNPTHAVLMVLAADDSGRDAFWVVAEWQHNGREKGQLTAAEQSARMAAWAAPIVEPSGLGFVTVLDPSAAPLRVQLRADGWPGVRGADNRVELGLQACLSLFGGERLYVDKARCPILWDELTGYVWDEKALERGEDEQPLKVNDHGPDALRYAVMAGRMIWRAWLPNLASTADARTAA
ncbi:phage terminase, large subunit, PBSX family [Lentzea xinjiangensis]|uniref:Phage terminase, large subunit, PBSX family n=1 Tax=Lentzea xinjiangensis TaxID=402600 RepID=A0A1H9TEB3_9PSEU|nr:phage terminase large subunit [Lentzea xinjiangensis]SER95446.1 phage terminase, large subunit, PBSX family [Lentzea xinjiangensis]